MADIHDETTDDNAAEARQSEVKQLLGERPDLLDFLTGREKRVLRLRFGLEDGRARTREEVGHELSVTPEQICQIEQKALRQLRHPYSRMTCRPPLPAEEPTDETCSLGHPMVIRLGRNGRFLTCSLFPEHKESRPLPGEEAEAPALPGVGEPCPTCGTAEGGVLVAKRGRFGPFVGCDRYPACDYIKREGPPPPAQLLLPSERGGPSRRSA